MSLSARNQVKGKIIELQLGAVNAELTLEIAPGVTLVSTLTKKACEDLQLEVGKEAYAVIKASCIMMAVR